jgi:hypothetical protein
MQPPPSAPPQWSPDGQWWWDGSRWRARSESLTPVAPSYPLPQLPPGYPMPPPGYPMPAPIVQMPAPIAMRPAPGLRMFLLIVLGVSGLFTGIFFSAGLSAVTNGSNTTGDILLFAFFTAVFALQVLAFVGVAIRARWSRWAAMIAGIGMMLTDIGIVLAIPIWIAAARAPDLTKKPA